jgi:hypothetical protein
MEDFMATPLDPKQIVSFEELSISQVVSQDALIKLLIEKGGLHQGRVFGDGEGGRSGDEKNRKIGYTYRHRL